MGLIDRAKNILVNPKEEWAVIEQEEPNIGALVTGYAIPLILLSAVCTFIGFAFISSVYRGLGMGYAIGMAVAQLLTALIGLFISAFVIDALAPSFGSEKNLGRAMQLVVYSGTAAWVAGILNILPFLMWVPMIAGLYGIYILYLGLPHMMKTPDDKRIIYMIVAFVVNAVVVMVLGGILATTLLGAFGVAALTASPY